MIVLDTDHLSCLEWGSSEPARLHEKLSTGSDLHIVVSVVSYEEQMRGWMSRLAKCSDID